MSEPLTETFARFAEDAEFRRWSEGRSLDFRFVYARQSEDVWKFTAEEWWRIVTRAIRNNGVCSLPPSKQLQMKAITLFSASRLCDNTRSVNLVRWTLNDWKSELAAIDPRAEVMDHLPGEYEL